VFIKNNLGLLEGTETLLAQQQRLNQITNNIANVDTSGYKKDSVTFWEMLYGSGGGRQRVGKAMNIRTDHGQGAFINTNSPLDFAIGGQGFFKIQTPMGVRFTRDGNFTLNSARQLSTMDGSLVLGEGGPIVLTSANVQVGRDGLISADGETVGQLSLASFSSPNELIKEGPNRFKPKDPAVQAGPVLEPNVLQGSLEESNVNVITEMTEMIDLQRAFQTQQKAIQTMDDIDGQAISRVGKLTT